MYTYPWYHWITFFFIYCFCGWIFESTYVSLKSRHFVNRGFLRLPMLPLYGTGAVMMLWASLPFKDHIVLVYFAGVVAATLLEYVTGYAMERLFKMKYWDYSNQPFNLHGYICLSSSIAWGFLTIFLTEVIHKPIAELVLNLNPILEFSMIAVVGALFVSDSIKSTKEALDLGRALESMTKLKAEVEELQLQLALLKAETAQKMADLGEMSLEDAAQHVADSISDSLEGAAQHVADSIADSLEGAAQHMAASLEGAVQRMSDMREETSQRVFAASRKLKEHRDREYDLSQRLTALYEKRRSLSHHVSFYRKDILRRNPTASSRRFAEALKELKEAIEAKRG